MSIYPWRGPHYWLLLLEVLAIGGVFGDQVGLECLAASVQMRRFECAAHDEALHATVFAGANAFNCAPEVDRQGFVLAGCVA